MDKRIAEHEETGREKARGASNRNLQSKAGAAVLRDRVETWAELLKNTKRNFSGSAKDLYNIEQYAFQHELAKRQLEYNHH